MTTTPKENPALPASGDRAQTKSEHLTDSPAPSTAQAAAGPSRAVHHVEHWLYRDGLRELAALIQSLAVRLDQAALRGQDTLARAHIADLRRGLLEAIDTLKRLEGLNARAGASHEPL
jgi:hypothetical protein